MEAGTGRAGRGNKQPVIRTRPTAGMSDAHWWRERRGAFFVVLDVVVVITLDARQAEPAEQHADLVSRASSGAKDRALHRTYHELDPTLAGLCSAGRKSL